MTGSKRTMRSRRTTLNRMTRSRRTTTFLIRPSPRPPPIEDRGGHLSTYIFDGGISIVTHNNVSRCSLELLQLAWVRKLPYEIFLSWIFMVRLWFDHSTSTSAFIRTLKLYSRMSQHDQERMMDPNEEDRTQEQSLHDHFEEVLYVKSMDDGGRDASVGSLSLKMRGLASQGAIVARSAVEDDETRRRPDINEVTSPQQGFKMSASTFAAHVI